RDDREIHAPYALSEDRVGERKRRHDGEDDDERQRGREALERQPPRRELLDAAPDHEVGKLGGRRLQLQEHRHHVAAEAEEDALAEAQDPPVPPGKHDPDRDEREGQVLAHQVEAKRIERQRKDDEQQHRHRRERPERARTASADRAHARTLAENSPFGRRYSTRMTSSRIETFAIDPLIRYSSVVCDCAMPNAESAVPTRLATPPNTTTMNESTMYSCPVPGFVDPIIVNTLPAMPASPEPSANVSASIRFVLMPAAPLIARFCMTARTESPQRVRYSNPYTARQTSTVRPTMNSRFSGSSIPSLTCHAPVSHDASGTLTSCAPKIDR